LILASRYYFLAAGAAASVAGGGFAFGAFFFLLLADDFRFGRGGFGHNGDFFLHGADRADDHHRDSTAAWRWPATECPWRAAAGAVRDVRRSPEHVRNRERRHFDFDSGVERFEHAAFFGALGGAAEFEATLTLTFWLGSMRSRSRCSDGGVAIIAGDALDQHFFRFCLRA